MSDSGDPTVVKVEFPADTRVVRVVRLAVSGLASLAGTDIDTIDDVKIAVDEICAALIEAGDGTALSLVLTLAGDRLDILGETASAGPAELDPDRFALSRQILRAVADRHELALRDGRLRFSVSCTLAGALGGA